MDHSCFHNHWPTSKTKLNENIFESKGVFRGPTQLAYREDRLCLWSQNNAVYICKRIQVLQKKMKVLRKHNVLSVNKNKEPQKKPKYWEKKISFANKNKKLQNVNLTEQKQWFCNTYFPWLLIYLQRCFYFATRFSQVWACDTFFPLRFTFLCGGWSQWMGSNTPGHASQEVTSSITTDPGTVIEQRHLGIQWPLVVEVLPTGYRTVLHAM